MLPTVIAIRPYVELAYFIGGVLLALGMILTFRQLKLMQADIELRGTRAAKEKAIEAINRYLTQFVDANSKAYNLCNAKGIKSYRGPIGDFSPNYALNLRIPFKEVEIHAANTFALNELQLVAAYFTTGVADERTGFDVIGRTFCHSVEADYDMISMCRSDAATKHWQHIVSLYQLWRPRLKESELKASAAAIELQLQTLSAKH